MTPLRFFLLPSLAAWLACTGAAAAAPAGTDGWQLSLRTDHHSDATRLADLDGDIERAPRPRSGRNLAYMDDEVRVSRQAGAWRWSLLARSSATLVTNRDTLDAAAQVDGLKDPDGSRRWRARLRFEGFTGAGIEAERGMALGGGWRARASVQALVLRHWRERDLHGTAGYDAATAGYSFDLRSSETDDRNRLPFQSDPASRGAALLFGGELTWADGPWQAAIGLRDAGWLHWRDMPRQDATLSSDTQAYDADGFLIYKPLIQGRNTQENRTDWHAPRWRGSVGRQVTDDGRASVGGEWVPGFGLLPQVAWQQRSGAVDWGAAWQLRERRVTLSLAWQGWQVAAGADRLGGDARSRVLALSYRLPL